MSSNTAQRLISLLPGTTEWVCALGLQSSLVGISHECDFPAGISPLPRVSGTLIQHESASLTIDAQVRAALAAGESLYQLDLAQIQRLAPTLLISQSLCAVCGVDSDTVSAALCAVPEAAEQFNFSPSQLDDLFAAIADHHRRVEEYAKMPADEILNRFGLSGPPQREEPSERNQALSSSK